MESSSTDRTVDTDAIIGTSAAASNNTPDDKDRTVPPPSQSSAAPSTTPAYGSQAYWEERYQNFNNDNSNKVDSNNVNIPKPTEDTPAPFHAWYFSFDELKPIVMPLILGEKEDAETETDAIETTASEPNKEEDTSEEANNDDNNPSTEEEEREDNENEGEWEEVAEGDGSEEEIDEEPRVVITANTPLTVLEVGCGDVPLGTGLAEEITQLAASTGQEATSIVDKIVCTDYSPAVIDMLNRLQHTKRKEPHISADNPPEAEKTFREETDRSHEGGAAGIPIEFEVADARKLSYTDGSFHLVMEKGTMDAMMSDPDVGASNCRQLISECARVLAVGGCFLLVSHINAQTDVGQKHLEEIMVPGLRDGGGKDAAWVMEVHGSEMDVGAAEEEEEEEDNSPGPVVYLMFKQNKSQQPATATAGSDDDDDTPPTIPLRFFSY